jgi:hypothetical protein
MRASLSFGFSWISVTVKAGDDPSAWRSARLVSPSRANASSRIASTRSERLRSLAIVKSQARWSESRFTPASASVRNMLSKRPRLASTVGFVVKTPSR